MKADSTTLAGILTPACRYVIPLFQRDYVWNKKDWENLWDDIVELGELQQHRKHFMGAMVFVAEQPLPNKVLTYQVIDGQQRLVTLSILLCALRDIASDRGFGNLSSEITAYYLTHPKQDDEHYRVYPRWRDRDQYTAAIGHKMVPGDTIRAALQFFTTQIAAMPDLDSEEGLRSFFSTLCQRLEFVQINLASDENPFQIFRSLECISKLDFSHFLAFSPEGNWVKIAPNFRFEIHS